jgi:glycerate kinase
LICYPHYMKVLICPDKFKGCLEAMEVAEAIAAGLATGMTATAAALTLTLLPLADGGEGTAEILRAATGGERLEVEAHDPLGRLVPSSFAVLGDGKTAVVEMAAASGFALLAPEERDPLRTSTFGTGELIRAALDAGLRRLIVAIGGSATNDGGMGMAAALGARFFNKEGLPLEPRGDALVRVASVDLSGLDPRVRECDVTVACDVANLLLGEEGATRVYGPQKGADTQALEVLEAGMTSYSHLVETAMGRQLATIPGAGAAGGLGFGLLAFLDARVEPGIEVVMRSVGFEDKARGCDLIVTGEGRYDAQTAYGKTVSGVTRAAAQLGVPLVILAGAVAGDVISSGTATREQAISILGITPRPMPLEEALSTARDNLRFTAAQLARLLEGCTG